MLAYIPVQEKPRVVDVDSFLTYHRMLHQYQALPHQILTGDRIRGEVSTSPAQMIILR